MPMENRCANPGVAVDITARKQVDAARAMGEARLKSIMETVPVGIMFAEAPSVAF